MSSYKLPGSLGEHLFQQQQGSQSRAQAFYRKQMLDHLNPAMREFLVEQELFFLATVDGQGECDCSLRVVEKGFLHAVDERTLLYPEYRGNGVYSSLGNVTENPHVALLVVDFFLHGIGLHVNGKARLWPPDEQTSARRRQPELWVAIDVVEAYLHCSKHIPLLSKCPAEIDGGTDDVQIKVGDFFQATKCFRPWANREDKGYPEECPR